MTHIKQGEDSVLYGVVIGITDELLPRYPHVEEVVALQQHSYGCGQAPNSVDAAIPNRQSAA